MSKVIHFEDHPGWKENMQDLAHELAVELQQFEVDSETLTAIQGAQKGDYAVIDIHDKLKNPVGYKLAKLAWERGLKTVIASDTATPSVAVEGVDIMKKADAFHWLEKEIKAERG